MSNPLIPIYRDREVGFMVKLAESKLIIVPAEFRGYDPPPWSTASVRNGRRMFGPGSRRHHQRDGRVVGDFAATLGAAT